MAYPTPHFSLPAQHFFGKCQGIVKLLQITIPSSQALAQRFRSTEYYVVLPVLQHRYLQVSSLLSVEWHLTTGVLTFTEF